MEYTPPSPLAPHPGNTSTSVPPRTAGPTNQSGMKAIHAPSIAACKTTSELSAVNGPDGRTVVRLPSFTNGQSGQVARPVKPRQACSVKSAGDRGLP
jgi:hypothetical protein